MSRAIRSLKKSSKFFQHSPMASLQACLLFLPLVAISLVSEAAQPRQPTIGPGSELYPTKTPTSWLSPSGRFAFGFYPEGSGFYVGIWLIRDPRNTTVIWTADRNQAPVSKDAFLTLTPDGLRVLQSPHDRSISSQLAADVSYASMLDSGNFVIYSSDGSILWETFDYPTDTIMANQTLWHGKELISSISETNRSEGKFRLKMQEDGNLVLYPTKTIDVANDAYWAAATFAEGYTSLNLDTNGRMYLQGTDKIHTLTSNFSSSPYVIYYASLNMDGFFQFCSHDLSINTTLVLAQFPISNNQCEIKGTCGFNSYCSFAKDQPVCLCLPGLEYVDASQKSSGCTLNNIGNGCKVNRDNITYTMATLENTNWLDDPYIVDLSLTSKEDCRDSCLEDCNCDGVLFNKDGTCSKQKFPMKYGKTSTDGSIVAFIKVGTQGLNQSTPVAPEIRIKKKQSSRILIVCAIIAVVVLVAVVAISFLLYRCQDGRYRRRKELRLAEELAPRYFTYHELKEATHGFMEELGKGAFGTVFKGNLCSGERVIAVKKLEKLVDEGEREFRTEMKGIGRTHHRNLVRLLGFCDEGSHRLLVYEYMSNGSLAEIIFKAEAWPQWDERVRIALDVARGIHYLHDECETRIIHCDIKPQNILMDGNWMAKISDFGLAKLMMPSQTRTFTGIRGTRGYLAPEWHKNAPITVKVDVYSFGIVLLEIICCRRNMELEAEADEIILVEWVYGCLVTGELEKLLVDEDVDMRELERLVKVGLWCIQTEPTLRPSMKNVVMMLEGNIQVSIPPPP